MRSSSKLDGAGADFSQPSPTRGACVELCLRQKVAEQRHLPPFHNAFLGFEHCMVAKARRILGAAALPCR